jgi:hypothetical protein
MTIWLAFPASKRNPLSLGKQSQSDSLFYRAVHSGQSLTSWLATHRRRPAVLSVAVLQYPSCVTVPSNLSTLRQFGLKAHVRHVFSTSRGCTALLLLNSSYPSSLCLFLLCGICLISNYDSLNPATH